MKKKTKKVKSKPKTKALNKALVKSSAVEECEMCSKEIPYGDTYCDECKGQT